MNAFIRRSLVGVLCAFTAVGTVQAAGAGGKTYVDSRGKQIVFPLGEISFADEVVSFESGHPAASDSRFSDPKLALGPPNYLNEDADKVAPAETTLGCAGTLVVRFVDNALIDVPGPDLYVFEVGPAVEAMHLAISTDGGAWTDVGDVSGGTAEIDIAKAAKPGERYHDVKVTDLKNDCSGEWPGADVDAVGAIGAALDISFDASVLFEFAKSNLKPEAQAALADAARKLAAYKGATATVEGHTDTIGGDDYNLKLSQARAESVRAFLSARPELKDFAMTAKGFGATKPVASNATEEGRRKNRRVEIVINPH